MKPASLIRLGHRQARHKETPLGASARRHRRTARSTLSVAKSLHLTPNSRVSDFPPALTSLLFPSLSPIFAPLPLSLCNHILNTIGSQSNLMHRYSLIKLICGDPSPPVCPPSRRHRSRRAFHPALPSSSSAINPKMPRTFRKMLLLNYFPDRDKQLLPVQHNCWLISDGENGDDSATNSRPPRPGMMPQAGGGTLSAVGLCCRCWN